MEVHSVSKNSFKIKTKQVSFLINPEKKTEDDVVIFTSKQSNLNEYQGKIVFDGPGEYEVGGVSILAEKDSRGAIAFDLLEDSQRLLVLSSTDAEKSNETEDYTATIIVPGEKFDGSLDKINSGLIVFVGDENLLPQDTTLTKKDKINLKKIEEYKGSVVHLSK